MTALPIADKPTLDAVMAYVDELETRLTAARAAYLDVAISSRAAAADYTAARAAKLDLIGAAADAAGTGSLFAYFKRLEAFVDALETDTGLIKGYVDTLETVVGTTGDAANASGTVLARLAELLTNRLTAARATKMDNISATTVVRGSTSLDTSTASIDVTIASVITAKSWVNVSNTSGSNGTAAALLVNGTTVRLTHSTGWQTDVAYWEVVQNA